MHICASNCCQDDTSSMETVQRLVWIQLSQGFMLIRFKAGRRKKLHEKSYEIGCEIIKNLYKEQKLTVGELDYGSKLYSCNWLSQFLEYFVFEICQHIENFNSKVLKKSEKSHNCQWLKTDKTLITFKKLYNFVFFLLDASKTVPSLSIKRRITFRASWREFKDDYSVASWIAMIRSKIRCHRIQASQKSVKIFIFPRKFS